MIDSVATRYHVLPSQVLARADTFDLWVLDIASSWQQQQQARAHAQATGQPPPAPDIPVNTLQAMLERVRR
jgi:hypothetical protein